MTEASKEIVDVLKRVRVRLSEPKAWTRVSGAQCGCVYCHIKREGPPAVKTCARLMDFVFDGFGLDVTDINDRRSTTHAHILRWLDTVIAHDSKLLGLDGG